MCKFKLLNNLPPNTRITREGVTHRFRPHCHKTSQRFFTFSGAERGIRRRIIGAFSPSNDTRVTCKICE